MSSQRKLVIATHNEGKVEEILKILGGIPWDLRSLREFPVGTAVESSDTYEGNAIAKARYYADKTKHLVLADDSGLEVTALGGAPGVLSARYAGENASDEDRRKLLLRELNARDAVNRQARFVCSSVIARPDGEVSYIATGVCNGTIAFEARGVSGFGYDPIFIPSGYDLTFGELSEEVKNKISHRARALSQVREFLLLKNA